MEITPRAATKNKQWDAPQMKSRGFSIDDVQLAVLMDIRDALLDIAKELPLIKAEIEGVMDAARRSQYRKLIQIRGVL